MTISSLWVGLIGAGTLLGLAGSLLVGKLSDQIGRRRLLLVDMYLLVLVSAAQLLTTNLAWTFVLRILAGLFMAVEYTAGNTLLIEWLPLKEGSRFQSRLVVYWVIGFIAAYATSASLTGAGPRSWIYMMVAPAVPALLTAIFRSLAKLPTSPVWLVNQGHPEIAQRVIRKHLGKRFGLARR